VLGAATRVAASSDRPDLTHSPATPRAVARPQRYESAYTVPIATRMTPQSLTMQPSRVRMGPPKYAPLPNHPVHIHPVRPFYRFMATGLGASMWFFVRQGSEVRGCG
jgi:hypothetical protein